MGGSLREWWQVGPGREGGTPKKHKEGVCSPLPKTPTLFMSSLEANL